MSKPTTINPIRPRRALANVSQATPNEESAKNRYCHLWATASVAVLEDAINSPPFVSSRNSGALSCSALTTTKTKIPTINVARSDRFIDRSGFCRRCNRVVRLHDQFAQKLVRRIHRCRSQHKSFLTRVLFDQAQSKLVILEQVLAKFVHAHAFGLSPFDQTSQRRFVKDNFQPVLGLEPVAKLARGRFQARTFRFFAFGHEA